MATTRPPTSPGDAAVDSAPLLASYGGTSRLSRGPSLRGAARFLRRASSRRLMREPSVQVRETAVEQLEERQSDWAYSRPVVFLDILWNLVFVSVAAVVLVLSRDERPSMPLRPWILGYALQCVLHMICVCIEYRQRHPPRREVMDVEEGWSVSGRSSGSNSPREVEEAADAEQGHGEARTR